MILFFVDGRQGMTADDENVADLIRRAGKPTILVVNKIDNVSQLNDVYDFYQLGMGDPIGVSSVNLLNFGDLLRKCANSSQTRSEGEEEDEAVKIAVVGKPNVGKSSLVKPAAGRGARDGFDIAGTTRDAIDTHFMDEGKNMCSSIRRASAASAPSPINRWNASPWCGRWRPSTGRTWCCFDRRHAGRH